MSDKVEVKYVRITGSPIKHIYLDTNATVCGIQPAIPFPAFTPVEATSPFPVCETCKIKAAK